MNSYLPRGIIVLASMLTGAAVGYIAHGPGPAANVEHNAIAAYFSPDGGCTDAVVREISMAHSTIHMQAYTFTSAPIAKALTDAAQRGVAVIAVLDQSNATERYTAASFLLNAQIPTYIDDQHTIAHNKVMIIDNSTLITGSFNFTKGAEENNAENLLIIKDDPTLVQAYEDNFQVHLKHSYIFRGGTTSGGTSSRWKWKTDRN